MEANEAAHMADIIASLGGLNLGLLLILIVEHIKAAGRVDKAELIAGELMAASMAIFILSDVASFSGHVHSMVEFLLSALAMVFLTVSLGWFMLWLRKRRSGHGH